MSEHTIYSSDVERIADFEFIEVTVGPVSLKQIAPPIIYSLNDFPDLAIELTDKRSGLNYWRFFNCTVEAIPKQRYNARHVWDSLVEEFGAELRYARGKTLDGEHRESSDAFVVTPWNNVTSVIKRLEEAATTRRRVSGTLNTADHFIMAELYIAGFFTLHLDNIYVPPSQNAGWYGSAMMGGEKRSFQIVPRGKVFQDVVDQLEMRDEMVVSIERFFAEQFPYLAHQPVFTLEHTVLPKEPWFGKGLLA